MLILTTAREARELVDRSNHCENALSINDVGFVNFSDVQRQKIHNLLELNCQDVEHPHIANAPTLQTIEAICVWAKLCESENALLHCSGSGARSTSAGLITLMEWGYGADHAVALVKMMRPTVRPNLLMLKLYGKLELLEAVMGSFSFAV